MTETYNPMQPWEVHQRVPEQQLFKAVIMAVVASACGKTDTIERREDRAYLCARTQRNQRDLHQICDWAGVSYDKVVETARRWERESSWPALSTVNKVTEGLIQLRKET